MFTIQFNFDPITSEITNLQVIKLETQKDEALIVLEDNKIRLSKGAIELIGVTVPGQIVIQYYTVSPEETFPVIGTPEMFALDSGQKLTKSKTVSFRGQQREILKQYGTLFKLEPFKNYFKLIPVEIAENDNLKEEEDDLNNLK